MTLDSAPADTPAGFEPAWLRGGRTRAHPTDALKGSVGRIPMVATLSVNGAAGSTLVRSAKPSMASAVPAWVICQ